MISRLLLIGLVFLTVSVAQAAQDAAPPAAETEKPQRTVPDTLMFTIDELNDVRSRAASANRVDEGRSGPRDAIEDATLFLSTILYYSPQDWTIWVNGAPITPRQDFSSFEVTEIGPDFVELLVPLSAQGMRPVRLSPNQTFIVRSGAVVEGRQ